MKKLIRSLATAAIAATAHPLCQAAGGAWDGIYTCGVNVLGSISQVYVTVNGQPDGQAIFAVAAIAPTTSFYGYGIGRITGNVFSGTTSFGAPFSVTSNASGFSGSIGIVIQGLNINASASCTKVW